MNLIGNLLFFLLGGFVLALGWALAGLLCCLTIVGIPIGIQCFKFAGLVLWPFGREIRERQTGVISLLANVLWLVFFGLELALVSAAMGLTFCVTLIGIPFGLQYFKFARLALMPFGAVVVPRQP